MHCLIEHRTSTDPVGGALKWISNGEYVHCHIRDLLGLLSIALCSIAFLCNPLGLDRHGDSKRHNEYEECHRRCE
jgi:hypothetical protein